MLSGSSLSVVIQGTEGEPWGSLGMAEKTKGDQASRGELS